MRPCASASSSVAGPSGRGLAAVAASSSMHSSSSSSSPLASSISMSSRRSVRRRKSHLRSLTSALSSLSLTSSDAFFVSSRHRSRRIAPLAAVSGERKTGGAVDADVDDGGARRARGVADNDEFRGRQDAPELGGRLVQWYPGHIAKAERRLKEALGKVDVVLEVLDARAPIASTHPMLGAWCSNSPASSSSASASGLFIGSDGTSSASSSASQMTGKPRILVLNRCDQVSAADRKEWDQFFREHVTGGVAPIWTDGEKGTNVALLKKAALAAAARANAGRARRGLAPRPARAVVVGLPNVGKSALINRLLGRRVAPSAPRHPHAACGAGDHPQINVRRS